MLKSDNSHWRHYRIYRREENQHHPFQRISVTALAVATTGLIMNESQFSERPVTPGFLRAGIHILRRHERVSCYCLHWIRPCLLLRRDMKALVYEAGGELQLLFGGGAEEGVW